MNILKRYSVLALVVIAVEVMLIYILSTPKENIARIPRTYQQIMAENNILYATALPVSFSEKKPEYVSSKLPAVLISAALPDGLRISADKKFISLGLVNISNMDSGIVIDLKYSTENNFLHKNLYGELFPKGWTPTNCYLQKDVAEKLVRAQKSLKKRFPFYSLIIYDAVRPVEIQKIMWDELQVPEKEKDKYVADPSVGSLHNYGCAVDVSIVNENGWEMDMGTPYDYFGELGHPVAEKRMLADGKLSWRQYENRKLLREVLTESGFTGISTEWWHFNGTSLKQAREKYRLID